MKMKNVEDIYPLTPLQQGMLFHSLSTPGASMYCDQLSWIIDDKIDVTAMRTAWQRVVNHHPILRASFLWEDLDEPLQVIRSKVRLPWQEFDWQSLNPQEQKKELKRFLKKDLQKGFELSKAPLMRISLIRLDENKFRIVWSLHHLLLDGWSLSLVLNEVFRIYESLRHGDEIEPAQTAPFRDYIAWLQKQDFNEARDFWKQALKGHNGLSLLFKGNNGASTAGENTEYGECQVILSTAETGMLEKYARTHGFTPNSLIQGAWAILLSRYSGEQRVIFGATVSGRPADLPGAESMIGLFINTLPVAVTIDYGQTLSANIRQIQDKQVEARQFEHTPLMQIKKWSNIPKSLPIFDSILVFENYPVDLNSICSNCKFDSESVLYSGHTHFPLHLRVYPGEQLSVTLVYNTGLVHNAIAEQMLNYLRQILINIPTIIETNLYQF
ncbi:MAG: condensation domain-containing protein, partial [Calditrichia bacterium]